jgi:hypothetical protein
MFAVSRAADIKQQLEERRRARIGQDIDAEMDANIEPVASTLGRARR